MADLIAIGYDDEETAAKAAEEVYRLANDLLIEPEAVAVITRDEKGKYKVTTNHHPVAEGATWGMLWGALFGLLFFVPVFGLAIGGAFGLLFGAIEKVGIDEGFQQEVRDMVKPGKLRAVPGRQKGHSGQGACRTEQVRRYRAQDVSDRRRRGAAA